MRRLAAALVLSVAAVSIVACSGTTPTSNTTSSSPSLPAAGVSAAAVGQLSATETSDVLSPKQIVQPYQQMPTDPSVVPADLLDKLNAKQPVLLYFYDPTEQVSNDEAAEISATLKKYPGVISLVSYDFTPGIPTSSTQTSVAPEVAKIELLAEALKVSTTPYILFIDRYGRITYRFAGYVDGGSPSLLERETLRATQ